MADLVYQLRGDPSDSLKQAAADEIARLENALDDNAEIMKGYLRIMDERADEIERLREEVKNLQRELDLIQTPTQM